MRWVWVMAISLAAVSVATADPAPKPAAPATSIPIPGLGLGAKPAAPAPSKPAAPDPLLVFYPPAARAAGMEGEAIISCGRDAHLALANCTLLSEIPVGQGFGAAALAMAAKSPQNPKVDYAAATQAPPSKIEVRFLLKPTPSVTPDLTEMAHTVAQPTIVTRPSADQVKAAYPVRALDDQVIGGSILDCLVTKAGALSDCQVAAERPTGYGFGAAALDVAKDFVLTPRRIDGDAVDGAEVRVGVAFGDLDPSAPLTISAPPPPDPDGPPPSSGSGAP